jgi:hypothetical protein
VGLATEQVAILCGDINKKSDFKNKKSDLSLRQNDNWAGLIPVFVNPGSWFCVTEQVANLLRQKTGIDEIRDLSVRFM